MVRVELMGMVRKYVGEEEREGKEGERERAGSNAVVCMITAVLFLENPCESIREDREGEGEL